MMPMSFIAAIYLFSLLRRRFAAFTLKVLSALLIAVVESLFLSYLNGVGSGSPQIPQAVNTG